MMILGLDPGSRITGYGVIEKENSRLRFVACGVVRSSDKYSFPERLKEIYSGVCEVIARVSPQVMAVEDIYCAVNPRSALKLGHARGVAILAALQYGLTIQEYSPRMVKQAVVGHGQATKEEVQQMVKILLKLSALPGKDPADALAIALCHANQVRLNRLISS